MNSAAPFASISSLFETILRDHPGERISVNDIKNGLQEQGFWLLMIPFAAPFILIFPYPPGFSTLVSVPLLLLCLQVALGRHSVWLPRWLNTKTVKRELVANILKKITPALNAIQKLLKPRLDGLLTPSTERALGIYCLILSLIIASPLPFSHFLPGIGIILIALSHVSRDGAGVLLGSLFGLAGIIFVSLEIFLGEELIKSLYHVIG